MADGTTLEVLIQIREELAGLNRTRQGLQGAKKDAEGLGSILKQGLGIGTGMQIATEAVALLKNSLKASVGSAFELAEAVKDQSEALEITTDAFQVLRYELAQAGVDTARLSMAVATQNQSLAAARSGAGDAAEAYRTLGLSISEVEQLSADRRLEVVARATLNATDKTRGFEAAAAILGQRGLPQLLNALRNLATNGYDATATAAKNAGAIMDAENVALLDRMKKRKDNFMDFTLPVATGAGISLFQNGMDFVGAAAGNLVNLLTGMPLATRVDMEGPEAAPAVNTPTGPTIARNRDVLAMRAALAEQKAGQIQNASLLDETQRRKALLPILREQEEIYTKLIETRFGDTAKSLPTNGQVTDEELQNFKERNELEAKLVAIRQERMVAVDTPLAKLGRDLNDTATYAAQTLADGLGSSINGLQADIWQAAKGTQSWRDAFRNLGSTAFDMLGQIITRMLLVQSINAALGLFGFGLGGGTGAGIVKLGATNVVKAAGGANFLTRGPTTLTVGDNPGGIEMVNVTPISGVGRTTVNGRVAQMGGGGTLVAGAGGGDTFNFNYQFNGGVSREDVLGMVPSLIQATKGAVLDAQKRRRDGFH